MKNIILPLLLANSSTTEAQKTKGMERDLAKTAPILIADAWVTGECTDATVTAAATAKTTAEGALSKLKAEKVKTQDAAVTAAITAKKEAVDKVIAEDKAIATKISADDVEQVKEMNLKKALDTATYAKATAVSAAAAAATAKTDADAKKAAAVASQTAMNTAKVAAGTHYTAEQGETASVKTKRGAAESDHNTKAALIANLSTLAANAKSAYDTGKVTWDAALQLKTDKASIKSKMIAALTAATTDFSDVTSIGGAAKANKAQVDAVATLKGNYDTAGAAWVLKGKATVAAMKEWAKTAPEAWSDVHATNGCDTATKAVDASGNADEATCKTKCEGKIAWVMNGGGTFPTGAIYSTAITSCTGEAWGSTICWHYHTTAVTAGGAGIAKTCKKRTKCAKATPLITADAASKAGTAEEVAWQAKLVLWTAGTKLQLVTKAALDIVEKYKIALAVSKGTADTASTNADTAYGTADGALTGFAATQTAKNTNLTTGNTDVANALALWNSLKASTTAQEAEEAAQLAIKTLAEGDLTAVNTVVTGLTTAATAADTAKTAADTANTAKATALTAATTAYNTQVTAAATTATALTAPLAALATLRTGAATATTALGTAIASSAGQQTLITNAQVVVDTATATHLAAVVACKEAAYDKYSATLATAEATRKTNIAAIEKLIKDNAPAARGTKGARCEKAMSNGTWRPKRNEKTCGDGLCCGAARVPMGNAVMTIETCQTKTDTTYQYVAPRAPMITTFPAAVAMPFMCIQGAQKLAAASAALATALYMMA